MKQFSGFYFSLSTLILQTNSFFHLKIGAQHQWRQLIWIAVMLAPLEVCSLPVNAQSSLNATFETGASPAGWFYTGFVKSTKLPCAGEYSLYCNFCSSKPKGEMLTAICMSKGLDLTNSLDHKMINISAPNPATPNALTWLGCKIRGLLSVLNYEIFLSYKNE